MADVLFRMDADTAKAVQGVLKLAEAQTKTETSAKKTAKSLSSIEKMGKQAGDAIKGMATGFVSFQALQGAVEGYHKAMEEASRKNRQFETEMTGLLSLGDNIKFGTKIKDQVLSMSNATGRARSEIADLMFTAQSSAGNLSKEMQDQLVGGALDVSKLTGEGAPETLRLLVKTWQTYGDQVKDVTDLQNKLILAAEMGDTTFADLAARLPEVNSAAKAVGISFDQVLTALISLTQKQGDVGKAFTQLRNYFLLSERAFNSGLLKNTGDFIGNLKQLETLNSEQLLKIFGTENLSGAKDLAASVADIAANLKTIETTSGNIAKEKVFERFADPNYRAADTAAKAEQIVENNEIMSGDKAARSERDSKYKIERDIWRDQMSPYLRDIPGLEATSFYAQKGASKAGEFIHNLPGENSFFGKRRDPNAYYSHRTDFLADMAIKQAQMDEGTSPEDIALYQAQQRNKAAREAVGSKPGGLFGSNAWAAPGGGGGGGNVTININHANFASPASAIREMNAKTAGLPAGM